MYVMKVNIIDFRYILMMLMHSVARHLKTINSRDNRKALAAILKDSVGDHRPSLRLGDKGVDTC